MYGTLDRVIACLLIFKVIPLFAYLFDLLWSKWMKKKLEKLIWKYSSLFFPQILIRYMSKNTSLDILWWEEIKMCKCSQSEWAGIWPFDWRNDKQCRPWLDCSKKSNLIWVLTVYLSVQKLKIITVSPTVQPVPWIWLIYFVVVWPSQNHRYWVLCCILTCHHLTASPWHHYLREPSQLKQVLFLLCV